MKTQVYFITICLFNISIEANIVDPNHTAPTGAVSGSTLFVYEASCILMDDKKNNTQFVIMRFMG